MPKAPSITQKQLKEYQTLAAEESQIHQKREVLRKNLLNGLEVGAAVEPGDLTAEVRRNHRRELSGPKLLPLLGKAKVEELKLAVEPTVQVCLIVQDKTQPKQAYVKQLAHSSSPSSDLDDGIGMKFKIASGD
jgi:hypothetical protein